VTEDDFHLSAAGRATFLSIKCSFSGLSKPEQARFLEWLSVEDGQPRLHVTLQATRLDDGRRGTSRGTSRE